MECNGKENNVSSRRKSEEKSEKKRQESVSPEPPAPVYNHKDEGQDKSDNSCRLPQKKQGKKKKKISLGENQQGRRQSGELIEILLIILTGIFLLSHWLVSM